MKGKTACTAVLKKPLLMPDGGEKGGEKGKTREISSSTLNFYFRGDKKREKR